MGVPAEGGAQPAGPALAAVRTAQQPRKELHPILVKGQLRRFQTPPVADAQGKVATEGLMFQASWDNVDLTPPPARWDTRAGMLQGFPSTGSREQWGCHLLLVMHAHIVNRNTNMHAGEQRRRAHGVQGPALRRWLCQHSPPRPWTLSRSPSPCRARSACRASSLART